MTSEESINTADRQQWSNPIEFLLASIATSVGLGNLWRFPPTAFMNGGGAFLIPYLLVVIFIARPLYFMEMVMGQFSSSGCVAIWKCVPAMKGIGLGQIIATWYVLTYYSYLMGLTVFYTVLSMSQVLPWSVCDEAWADDRCVDSISTNNSLNTSSYYESSSEQFYRNYVTNMKEDISDGLGVPDWRMSLCLLFCWVVLFLSLAWGVKSTGKVVYFTAIFPYVVLITLMIRGAILPGALQGILYFITPQWSYLLKPSVWFAAVVQAFYSLTTGNGILFHLSSYNTFNYNVYRDTLIISVMDTFTSLLAGFSTFSILGNLAFKLNTNISQVVRSGPGLVFISYPEALAKFTSTPQLFSVLLFLMMFTLSLGTVQSYTGAVITVIIDKCPKANRIGVTFAVCFVTFFVSLTYTTPGGQSVLTLIDYFGGGFIIFIYAPLEMMAIGFIYGISNLMRDVQFMLNTKLGVYWKVCWYTSPFLLLLIFVYSMIYLQLPTVNNKLLPDEAYAVGWILTGIAIIVFPLCFLDALYHEKGETIQKRLKRIFQPAADWGPMKEIYRREWEKLMRKNRT